MSAGSSLLGIVVVVSGSKVAQLEHEIHIANYTMQRLREAGVPVVGALFPVATNGKLTLEVDDLATGDMTWTWQP